MQIKKVLLLWVDLNWINYLHIFIVSYRYANNFFQVYKKWSLILWWSSSSSSYFMCVHHHIYDMSGIISYIIIIIIIIIIYMSMGHVCVGIFIQMLSLGMIRIRCKGIRALASIYRSSLELILNVVENSIEIRARRWSVPIHESPQFLCNSFIKASQMSIIRLRLGLMEMMLMQVEVEIKRHFFLI